MDVWVAIGEENALKMVEALKEFGFNLPQLQKELFMTKERESTPNRDFARVSLELPDASEICCM